MSWSGVKTSAVCLHSELRSIHCRLELALSKEAKWQNKMLVRGWGESRESKWEQRKRYITGMSHVLGWRSAVSVHNAQRAKEQSEFFF